MREWTKLPTSWISNGKLAEFRWKGENKSANTAALMVLLFFGHKLSPDENFIRITYDEIELAVGISRTMISRGVEKLLELELVEKISRSTFKILKYSPVEGRWGKLPAKRMYGKSGEILCLKDFSLRKKSELNALKIYFLFVERRDNNSNYIYLNFEQISERSSVPKNDVKAALSLLALNNMIIVDKKSKVLTEGRSVYTNMYRIANVSPRIHLGTLRETEDLIYDPESPF